MFRCVEGGRFVVLAAGSVLFGLAHTPQARAQSIGDYSRAQRAVIESAISRNGPRPPVELPTLAPAKGPGPLKDAGVPTGPPPSPPSIPKPAEPAQTDIAVTGVVLSSAVSLAEVVIDGAPFLLSSGQRVPGTRWSVSTVDADRVVLSGESRQRGVKPATRTFLLAGPGS
jgi:hypothetical protein